MNDKIKNLLSKDITIEDLKTHKKLTALAAVFFICVSIVFSEAFSNFDEAEYVSKNSSEPVKKSKPARKISNPNREIIYAETAEKFETIDPFSPEHLTEEDIIELESEVETDIETEIEDNIEEKIETELDKNIDTKTEEKIPESVQNLETVPEIKKVSFVLKGILYDGRNSVAIIEQDFEKMLSIGESIDHRKILDIQPDFIVLDTGEKIYIEF